MDYGYQLLRHTIMQVFGNLRQAARITLTLLAIPLVILFVSNPDLLFTQIVQFDAATGQNDFTTASILGLLLAVFVGVICWLWAAVAWHRFVLLEEYPTGILPNWRGSNIGNYFGNALLIGLVLVAAGFGGAIVVGILVTAIPSYALGVLLGFGLIFCLSWIATRIGLILPAAALGEKLRIGESWKATAPVSGQIILPMVVIALASTILNQGIIALTGTTALVETSFGLQEQITLSSAGLLFSITVTWVQMLVNLALMTTLYGNLIEGRQLN